jgi:hypothetical protein
MIRFPSSPRWLTALLLAAVLAGCRRQAPRTVDWQPASGARPEAAALLVLDKDGLAKLACLPERAPARQLFPGIALQRILDARWQGGAMVAAWAVAADDHPGASGELVLLLPHDSPRRLAKGVRTARFTPDGTALAYEVARPGASEAGESYVLELATGRVTELAASVDPLWEADGKHLRVTRLRPVGEEPRAPTSLRARWDRESGDTTIDGPGSAQIPAPLGSGVAWSESQRSPTAPSDCTVLLLPRGGVPHSVVGRFCQGIADDRAVRWSPDGQWLAFPHPGRPAGQPFFVDVVSARGGRSPALSALHAKARPDQIAIAAGAGSVWLDWSPSGRFLAMHDHASELRVYDFAAQAVARLGKGQRPMWSPGGAYLLMREAASEGSAAAAFVLLSPAARIDLGLVWDAGWLPARACEE